MITRAFDLPGLGHDAGRHLDVCGQVLLPARRRLRRRLRDPRPPRSEANPDPKVFERPRQLLAVLQQRVPRLPSGQIPWDLIVKRYVVMLH